MLKNGIVMHNYICMYRIKSLLWVSYSKQISKFWGSQRMQIIQSSLVNSSVLEHHHCDFFSPLHSVGISFLTNKWELRFCSALFRAICLWYISLITGVALVHITGFWLLDLFPHSYLEIGISLHRIMSCQW